MFLFWCVAPATASYPAATAAWNSGSVKAGAVVNSAVGTAGSSIVGLSSPVDIDSELDLD
jgi:hypothetical protein